VFVPFRFNLVCFGGSNCGNGEIECQLVGVTLRPILSSQPLTLSLSHSSQKCRSSGPNDGHLSGGSALGLGTSSALERRVLSHLALCLDSTGLTHMLSLALKGEPRTSSAEFKINSCTLCPKRRDSHTASGRIGNTQATHGRQSALCTLLHSTVRFTVCSALNCTALGRTALHTLTEASCQRLRLTGPARSQSAWRPSGWRARASEQPNARTARREPFFSQSRGQLRRVPGPSWA